MLINNHWGAGIAYVVYRLGCGLDDPRYESLQRTRNVSLFRNFRTSSTDHPPSYAVGIGVPSRE
jgi:hypothetical protein